MLSERGTIVKSRKRVSGANKSAGKSGSMPAGTKKPDGVRGGCCERVRQTFRGMTDNKVLLSFLVFLIIAIIVVGVVRNVQDDDGLSEDVAEAIGDAVEEDLKDGNADMEYEDIKQQLKDQGINREFAWHLEDEEGNLIQVDGKPCIGSPQASVNGQECS